MNKTANLMLYFKKNRQEMIAAVVLMLAVTVFCLPLLLRLDKAYTIVEKENRNVWYDYYHNAAFFYDSVVNRHQLPFWCYSYEGGARGSWFANPTDVSLNPFSLPILLLGVVKGLNFSWYLFYLIGALSMYALTRYVLKFNQSGAIYSALVFSLSSYFPYMQECGYFTAREMLLLPLLTAFFLKSLSENKYIVPAALTLVFIIYQASLYYAIVFLFLLILTIFKVFEDKGIRLVLVRRYLAVFSVIILLSLVFSAFKLFPLMTILTADIRVSGDTYKTSELITGPLGLFVKRLVTPGKITPGGMYVGYLPVIMFAAASIFFYRKLKIFIAMFVFFVLLSLGAYSPFDLHYLMWHLPIFRSIKEIAQYYGVIVLFLFSIICGASFKIFDGSKTYSVRRMVLPLIIILASFSNLCWANSNYFNVYNTSLSSPSKQSPSNVAQVRQISFWWGDEGGLPLFRYALFLHGYGMVNFHYTFNNYFKYLPVAPKYYALPEYAFMIPGTKAMLLPNPEYRGEAFFTKRKNKVLSCVFLPAAIEINVEVEEPDLLRINQSYDEFWFSDSGKLEESDELLALPVTEIGNYRISLKYIPVYFYLGLFISVFSLLGAVWVFYFSKNFPGRAPGIKTESRT